MSGQLAVRCAVSVSRQITRHQRTLVARNIYHQRHLATQNSRLATSLNHVISSHSTCHSCTVHRSLHTTHGCYNITPGTNKSLSNQAEESKSLTGVTEAKTSLADAPEIKTSLTDALVIKTSLADAPEVKTSLANQTVAGVPKQKTSQANQSKVDSSLPWQQKLLSKTLVELRQEAEELAVKIIRVRARKWEELETSDSSRDEARHLLERTLIMGAAEECKTTDPEECRKHDTQIVQSYFESLGCGDVTILDVGRKDEGEKVRDLMIVVSSVEMRDRVVQALRANKVAGDKRKLFVRSVGSPKEELIRQLQRQEIQMRLFTSRRFHTFPFFWRVEGSWVWGRVPRNTSRRPDAEFIQEAIKEIHHRKLKLKKIRRGDEEEAREREVARSSLRFHQRNSNITAETVNSALKHLGYEPSQMKLHHEPRRLRQESREEEVAWCYRAEMGDPESARKLKGAARLLNEQEELKDVVVSYLSTDLESYLDKLQRQEVSLRNQLATLRGESEDWYLRGSMVQRRGSEQERRRGAGEGGRVREQVAE